MNRERQLQLYQDFITNCTTNSKSLKNYVDFKRINECLLQLFPERKDVSILDFDDSIGFEKVVNNLNELETYIDINTKGKNQYSTTVSWYQRFLNAKNLFSKQEKNINSIKDSKNLPLQQIFYGAPGTGKSHTINEITEQQPKENVFRTTFHPDSDYSTFVGCYKPTKSKSGQNVKQAILDYDSLVDKFKEYLNVPNANITKVCTQFGFDYHDSIVRIQEQGRKVMDLVNDAYKSNTSYDSVVRGGMACYEQVLSKVSGSSITYEFVPQSFTKAYLRAWQTTEPVYLVIEEINRGNCAQIFGDLFQLLDRKCDGFSEYPIKADNDLASYIAENLSASIRTDIPDSVRSGEELSLPSNLYIWATMNTSDQSLFPIDSAFKRRWNWVYMPIDTKKENWSIRIGNDYYSWTAFLNKVNDELLTDETAEDKHLGFYFCKASEKKNESDQKPTIITQEAFVAKVLFYLWSDVFKVYGIPAAIGSSKDWAFAKFYNINGTINEAKVKDLMSKLNISAFTDDTIDIEVMENSAEAKNSTKNTLKSVAFPDGVVFDTSVSVFDAYVKAVEKIGIEKIIPVIDRIKFQRSNRPLISTVKYPELDNKDGFSYYQIGNCYFVKGTHTYTYVRILEVLNELLNVGMTIEN